MKFFLLKCSGCFFLLMFFAVTLQAQAAVIMEPIWSLTDDGSEEWPYYSAVLGNFGSEAFLPNLGFNNPASRLFSAYDENPPSPIMEYLQTGYSFDDSSFNEKWLVDSVQDGNTYASLFFWAAGLTGTDRVPVVRKFSLNGLEWSWQFPLDIDTHPYYGGVGLSDDGNVLNAWVYHSPNLYIARFEDDSGSPVSYETFQGFGPPRGVRFSADGRYAYVGYAIRTHIIDLITSQIVYSLTNWIHTIPGHALSADASVFVQSWLDETIHAYRQNGQTYEEFFSLDVHDMPGVSTGTQYCDELDISRDGSFFAFACIDWGDNRTVNVFGFDLNSGNLVLQDSITGIGQYDNTVTDLSVSPDGTAFAVTMWGDGSGPAPILAVYTKSGSEWRLWGTYDHDGSAHHADINAKNGIGTLILRSYSNHANGGSGGDNSIISLFNIGDGLAMIGTPRQNQSSIFKLERVQAGAVLLSGSLAANPINIPGVGWLYLNPNDLTILPPAVANSQGIVEIPYTFSQSPGSDLYAQGLKFTQNVERSLTGNYLKMTVYQGGGNIPLPPTNVRASDGHENLTISWTAAEGASSYRIYRGLNNNPNSSTYVGDTSGTSFIDIQSDPGVKYYYWVQSVGSDGTSQYSLSDDGYWIGIPQNVNASDGTYSDRIILTWNAVAGANNYRIYRNQTGVACAGTLINDQSPPYEDLNVVPETVYHYSIKSVSSAGPSVSCSVVDTGFSSNEPPEQTCADSGATDNGDGTCTLQINAHAGDTHIMKIGSTWPEVRNAVSGGSTDPMNGLANSSAYIHTSHGGQISYGIRRFFVSFDSSSLPDFSEILSASLNFYPGSITPNTGSVLNVYENNAPNPLNYALSDYSLCPTNNPNARDMLGQIPLDYPDNSLQWQSVNLSNPNAVNRTGYTQLCLRQNIDAVNAIPTDHYAVLLWTANNYNKPFLKVTYRP